MTGLQDLTHETARSLAGRLDRLHDRLATLGEALRAEVARAVSGTAAEAVRAAVQKLLNQLLAPAPRPPRSPAWDDDYDQDDDWPERRPESWAPEDDWGRDDTDRHDPRAARRPSPRWGRWRLALTVGWQAAAGLWRRGHRLPALAAALAGLAAGLLAAPGGTVLTAGAAAATTTLALVAVADAARRAVQLIARWAVPARL